LAIEPFYVLKDFGNVKVRYNTIFENDEIINKVALWGELAEKLSIALNYSAPVFLDFGYYNCNPDLVTAYDRVDNEYLWGTNTKSLIWDDNKNKVLFREVGNFLESEAIVIRQVESNQPQTTLKLLEYAILNLNHIKLTQKKIQYNTRYCSNELNSIDTLEIEKILKTPNSDLINNILNQKLYRPEKDFMYGISYYWQNNEYYIFQKNSYNYAGHESVVASIKNVYKVWKIGDSSALIFDTDSSFYYVETGRAVYTVGDSIVRQSDAHLSERQVIENKGNYRIFKVEYIDDKKLAIYLTYNSMIRIKGENEDRTLKFLIKENKLIQDSGNRQSNRE